MFILFVRPRSRVLDFVLFPVDHIVACAAGILSPRPRGDSLVILREETQRAKDGRASVRDGFRIGFARDVHGLDGDATALQHV